MVKCNNCGNEFTSENNFCPHCGVAYIKPIVNEQPQSDVVMCSSCGNEVPSGNNFCPKCGSSISSVNAAPQENTLKMSQQQFVGSAQPQQNMAQQPNINIQPQQNPNMGYQQNPNAAYQQNNMVRCTNCGNMYSPASQFCPYCGAQPVNREKHTTAIVLGYIFAILGGWLGLILGLYLVRCKEKEVHIHGYIQIAIFAFWVIVLLISMA